jgi:hypothetical protein
VRCINGVLGRYLRHSFRIPSIPQAFLNFKDFINFCTSHGLTQGDYRLRLLCARSTLGSRPDLNWEFGTLIQFIY